MSLKWNENVTLVFLNAYQKHPCLWNPYYVKYYDCLAKNDALKNIIKELNIPELNISDCLEQIKLIRKKYGQEQIRIIKGFQSGKPYKSPLAWFSIIVEMLTKVIDDESKLQNRIGSMKMISPVKDCITVPYDNNSRYKNVSNFPCMQDYKSKSRKNNKFTKSDKKRSFEHESEGQSNTQLLQCPSCGWEDINPNKLDIKTVKKAYENIKPNNNYIYYPQSTCNYINQQMKETTSVATVASKLTFCTKKAQLSSKQLLPERRTKQVGTIIEQCNKGIQNTEVSKQVAVNTVKQCDKEIQNTICANPSNCQVFQIYSSTQETKSIDANIMKCPTNDMRNTIGIKLKTVEGSMPNFILITTDGNYLPLIQRDLKEFTTNKCQKDEAEKAHFALGNKKLVENEVCTKKTCSSLLSHNVMEIIKHNSAVTQSLLQCLEKIMQTKTNVYSVTPHLSKIDVNSNSSEVTICEQIPCKFRNENIHSNASSAAELESLSCLLCLEKVEKDNAIAKPFEALLQLMKHAFVMNSKNVQTNDVKKDDAINTFIVLNKIKECADEILKIYTLVDWSKRQILNKFCKSKSKSICLSRKNSALNSNQTQDSKEDVVDHFTTANANSKDVEVYEPSTSKIRDYSLLENDTTHAETMMDKPFVKDKDVTASIENHDIDLNISLPQILLRDSETQYTSKQLQDTGIVTNSNFEEKISVATQNHEPILIRVIKSNNSEDILKLDKETCVRDAHVLWNVDKYSKNMLQKKYVSVKKYYDKLLHPGISHVREKEVNCIDYCTSLLRTVPNSSNRIYRYYKGCRSSLPCHHDWIKTNIANFGISSIQRISRIPLYARSRKYTQRRTDLYRMSRSYV
ncbi:PREDICTED: uncharacterized protein LOC108748439 isoform X2 [Trachymyrmex septentrionalis]|uniref:uncharacterized protein LOC108748439 isoform X2 n=1 Tax=Trachymyrmex septentrionalis TaxID=34720 RepID=UPI00084F166E|nr:PREDICTED: uncharacterized protein LOC108748439 isoform X2 [Trachymyrmex septentrionalis]